MPLIDMPLEQLKAYAGRSPKPADFDEYWAKAIQELDETPLNPEFIPSAFRVKGVECFDLYFTGVGGSRVHAKFLKPAAIDGKARAVLQFHGYSGDSGDWAGKLGYALEGFVLAALDCRGQGGLSDHTEPTRGTTQSGLIIRGLNDPDKTKLYYRQVFLDTLALSRIVMALPYVDETKVGAMGNSQGGGLTLACASLQPKLNRAFPIHPFLCDYRRVWEMDMAERAYLELKNFFRHFDPRHERENEIFERLGYIDVANLAPRIRCEVKLLTGLMDNVCPPSTQFAAYNRIPSKKSTVLYPDFGHEFLPDSDDLAFQFMREM
ncbi:MAG: acetylxylan esterase [Christensenellaceae bacterium]|jgi:cephalosporin-C deacetylase|nr:acetylxylan esterase [Christensenellaceae bacterium]